MNYENNSQLFRCDLPWNRKNSVVVVVIVIYKRSARNDHWQAYNIRITGGG